MKVLSLFVVLFAVSTLSFDIPFLSKNRYSPLIPVSELDLSKYAGSWYEIARLPYAFEAECYCNIATYTLNTAGYVDVKNTCNWGSATGRSLIVNGKATADDPINGTITTGNLTVEFFGILKAPYYVIEVDADYQYALVGSPNRDYLWILARTPTIDDDLYNQLASVAQTDEFDLNKFVKTYQGSECNRSEEPINI